MDTTDTIERIRRTDDEIKARMEEYRQSPGTHQGHRLIILHDALTFRGESDIRASARATVQGTIFFAEPDVRLDVARLEEFAWLMARDDVLVDMAHAAEHRGQGWPEVWAFAVHLDPYTENLWAQGVKHHPEIAEWAAGLPTPPSTEPEPF